MIRITIRIYAKYWFISTISVQIAINQFVCICKSLPCRIIIPTPKIVQSRFYIIDIPPIAERLDRTQGSSERTGGGDRLAPRIVSVFYHFGAVGVNDSDNIALEIMNVSILRAIELHNSGAVLGVVIALSNAKLRARNPLDCCPKPALPEGKSAGRYSAVQREAEGMHSFGLLPETRAYPTGKRGAYKKWRVLLPWVMCTMFLPCRM